MGIAQRGPQRSVRIGGSIKIAQRPGTATGFLFFVYFSFCFWLRNKPLKGVLLYSVHTFYSSCAINIHIFLQKVNARGRALKATRQRNSEPKALKEERKRVGVGESFRGTLWPRF